MAVDPLSHSTRLTKRNLLGVSAVSLLHSMGWLSIDKISVWGNGILKDGTLGVIFGSLIIYLSISLGFRMFEDLQNPDSPPTDSNGLRAAAPRQERMAAAEDAAFGISYGFLKLYLQSKYSAIRRSFYGDESSLVMNTATAAKDLINAKFLSQNLRILLFEEVERLVEGELKGEADRNLALNFLKRWLIPILVLKSIPIYLRRILWSDRLYKVVSRAGQLFEYGLPYAVGALALYALSNQSVAQQWTKSILG